MFSYVLAILGIILLSPIGLDILVIIVLQTINLVGGPRPVDVGEPLGGISR